MKVSTEARAVQWQIHVPLNEEFRSRLVKAMEHSRRGLEIYFDPENDFAAATFHTFDRDPDTMPVRFTSSDLLAITLLGVYIDSPSTVRALLRDESDVVEEFLTEIVDVDLWDAEERTLVWSNAFWWWLLDHDGIGEVIAGKLLARMRSEAGARVGATLVRRWPRNPTRIPVQTKRRCSAASRRAVGCASYLITAGLETPAAAAPA